MIRQGLPCGERRRRFIGIWLAPANCGSDETLERRARRGTNAAPKLTGSRANLAWYKSKQGIFQQFSTCRTLSRRPCGRHRCTAARHRGCRSAFGPGCSIPPRPRCVPTVVAAAASTGAQIRASRQSRALRRPGCAPRPGRSDGRHPPSDGPTTTLSPTPTRAPAPPRPQLHPRPMNSRCLPPRTAATPIGASDPAPLGVPRRRHRGRRRRPAPPWSPPLLGEVAAPAWRLNPTASSGSPRERPCPWKVLSRYTQTTSNETAVQKLPCSFCLGWRGGPRFCPQFAARPPSYPAGPLPPAPALPPARPLPPPPPGTVVVARWCSPVAPIEAVSPI